MLKKQSVVFFIGAGFSAPFGLPVMSNFINMSKDLYLSDETKYQNIGRTLKLIDKYSSVKNYMNLNLFNIEELLSLSYMDSLINKKRKLYKDIQQFIETVIKEYTGNVSEGVYQFVKVISNVKYKKGNRLFTDHSSGRDIYELLYLGKREENTNYGLISLNYDLLIENALIKLAENNGKFYSLERTYNKNEKYYSIISNIDEYEYGIPMAKLHGTVGGEIVPPTWNKSIDNKLFNDWVLADHLLRNSTHIVFLGYSLPSSDNYIKYLLANSMNNNKKLKNISVITLDYDGETKRRYDELFTLKPKMHNIRIEKYFELIEEHKVIDYDLFDNYITETYGG